MKLYKIDEEIQVHNYKEPIAVLDGSLITFIGPVTVEEAKKIIIYAENFDDLHGSLTEEP
ncbi:MAG: hypothetical protein M0P47_09485 [Bacteroidales bacterium]|jgi:hypothetical protein|nr:hypothetical protein [Bacteroidales bacterium]